MLQIISRVQTIMSKVFIKDVHNYVKFWGTLKVDRIRTLKWWEFLETDFLSPLALCAVTGKGHIVSLCDTIPWSKTSKGSRWKGTVDMEVTFVCEFPLVKIVGKYRREEKKQYCYLHAITTWGLFPWTSLSPVDKYLHKVYSLQVFRSQPWELSVS
jgi:hypothetical protein